jgi:hypothetical protein
MRVDDVFMKITALCNIAPCSCVEFDQSFRGAYCLHHEGDEDDYDSKHVWNVGHLLPDYTVQYPARLIFNVEVLWHIKA